MKLTLKSLWLINFKGIRNLHVDFTNVTNVYGENASGKTTLFDAVSWILNGKDSTDRKDFEIKTLDADNKVIPKIEHEAGAIFDIDGTTTTLKKILKEKWVKKRGLSEAEFTGNETLYYWNDVPMQQQEYQAKINGMMNENLLKLLTNPLYFNSMKWQDRRNILIALVGDVSDNEISEGNQAFIDMLAQMSGKSFKEYKAQIGARKKLLKDKIEKIPTRIDEVDKSMPPLLNWNVIKNELAEKQQELSNIDSKIEDGTRALQEKHNEIRGKQNKIHELTTEAKNLEFSTREKLKDANRSQASDIASLERDINEATRSIADNNAGIQRANAAKNTQVSERDGLRARYEKVAAEELVFNEPEFTCPTCRRAYEEADIEKKKQELTENFNQSKSKRLADISASGKNINEYLAKQDELIAGFTASNDTLRAKIDSLGERLSLLKDAQSEFDNTLGVEIQKALQADARYNEITETIDTLSSEVKEVPTVDNTELKSRKVVITGEIDALKQQLATNDQIDRAILRIAELEKEQSKYSQQLAELEGVEFTMEQFNKAKMSLIEDRINSKFQTVKFKLFDQQINGGEVECCDTLINGVPFTDANNAAKINAGLDIINTLCHHHGVFAPIFIDNRESVNNLIHCQSQIINLIVSTDKELKVA